MAIRVGIVGFGKLGLLHAGMMNGLTGSTLSCVADPSSTSLKMLKSQLEHLEVFENHKDLLKSGLADAVFICTPTSLHCDIAADCIDVGLPIFIEKPLATTFKDAQKLMARTEGRKITTMVGYMSRYTDSFRQARKILQSQALGSIQMIQSSMYISQLFTEGKGWRYSKLQSGGGVLATQNSHLIDMLFWFFGPVQKVSSHTRSFYSKEVEDWFHGFIQFKSGVSCTLDTSWSKRHHRSLTMSILIQGENGTLEVNDDEVRLYLVKENKGYAANWSTFKKPDLFQGVELDLAGQHYCRQATDFLHHIQNKTQPESNLQSATYVQKIIEALYQSARGDGTPIEIDKMEIS